MLSLRFMFGFLLIFPYANFSFVNLSNGLGSVWLLNIGERLVKIASQRLVVCFNQSLPPSLFIFLARFPLSIKSTTLYYGKSPTSSLIVEWSNVENNFFIFVMLLVTILSNIVHIAFIISNCTYKNLFACWLEKVETKSLKRKFKTNVLYHKSVQIQIPLGYSSVSHRLHPTLATLLAISNWIQIRFPYVHRD